MEVVVKDKIYQLNTYYYLTQDEYKELEINEYGKSLLYPDLFFNSTKIFFFSEEEYKIYITDYSNIDFINSISNKTVTIDTFSIYPSLAINAYTGFSKKYPEYIFTIHSDNFAFVELSILRFQ